MGLVIERGDRSMCRLSINQCGDGVDVSEAKVLETEVRKLIVGQDDAIEQIVSIYQTYLAGMATSGQPIGSFLFLGPTGSGKTRLVEATDTGRVSETPTVIKIDCAEFQHSHEIAKLIGSPPGYLGHRETHPLLSQEVLNQYHTEKVKLSVVLLDEIEKASDALWNLLLGILDKGWLTVGDNRQVEFSRTMIFMTSNLGVPQMKLGHRAEIEKASDALWNLLPGILYTETLTSGHSRGVDFSQIMIFMTSNLGGVEMRSNAPGTCHSLTPISWLSLVASMGYEAIGQRALEQFRGERHVN